MQNYVSQNEADELCLGLLRDYIGKGKELPICIDIEGFLTQYLGATLIYENISERNGDVIAFTSDGEHTLHVVRDGKVQEVLFSKKTVVLDRFLLRVEESARRRFAMAHEGGHILDEHISPYPAFKAEYNFTNQYEFKEFRERMNFSEHHADRIGAATICPLPSLERALREYNAGRRVPLYGDSVFPKREKVILRKMADAMGITHSVLVYRMKRFGMFSYHPIDEFIIKEFRQAGDEI